MKHTWKKPELIILVRGRPEEVLLLQCRTNVVGSGPQQTATHCNEAGPQHDPPTQYQCNNCRAQTGS